MNPSAERTFKMKFTKLVMMLNAIVLLAAIGIVAAFGLIPIFSTAIAAVCFIIVVILAVLFAKHYKRDKEWLMSQED